MNDRNSRKDEVDSAAAAWAVRLAGSPLSEAERNELDRWLDESALHAAALDEARAAWAKMGDLRFAPGALLDDAVVPLKLAAKRRPGAPKRSRLPTAWIAAASLAACLALLVGAARLWFGDPYILLAADHRTAPGVQRAVTLSDGSSVDLGAETALAVRFTEDQRQVELLAGSAYFTVAPQPGDRSAPFVVIAGQGAARALGTQFMVERQGETAEITVIEHSVEITLTSPGDATSQLLLASGHSVRYDENGFREIEPRPRDHAAAWRRGRLIFDRRPLGEVVAELNRYRRGRIVIADSELASRRVSGVFDMTDPDSVLTIIVRDLQIDAASLPPFLTLLY